MSYSVNRSATDANPFHGSFRSLHDETDAQPLYPPTAYQQHQPPPPPPPQHAYAPVAPAAASASGERAGLLHASAPARPERLRRETASTVYRRIVFYVGTIYFCAATIKFPFLITNLTFWFWAVHMFFFELELTSLRHSALLRMLHGLSFIGAFDVFALDTVLLIYNPDLIAQRSAQEHLPVWMMWVLNGVLHWLPVILVLIDVGVSRHVLKARHDLRIVRRMLRNARAVDWVKVVWMTLSPMILMGIWLACFSIEQVYGANVNMAVMLPIGVVVNLLAATLLVGLVSHVTPDVMVSYFSTHLHS